MSGEEALPLHTDTRGLAVKALQGFGQSLIPIAAMIYGSATIGVLLVVPMTAAIIAASIFFAWIRWKHLTYVTGPEDIRVEQGIFSRSARSMPYERIQDVSLEQKFLPRLFGLAEVKFETGAGGKDEISLSYLSLEEGERLRELVRARKDGALVQAVVAEDAAPVPVAASERLFAIDTKRLLTFGLFQFSLTIFAVFLGAASQVDFLFPFPLWEWKEWYRLLEGQGSHVAALGRMGGALVLLAGVGAVVALGVLTGMVMTVARDYGFLLERTPKGFRRRRGLFNKSDTTLPAHRVQAAIVGTRWIRRLFGWYGLEFVSLAQDGAEKGSGSRNFAAVPFARLEEIVPVLRAAGIEPPAEDIAWLRPSPKPWIDDTILHTLFFTVLGAVAFAIFRGPILPSIAALLAVWTMAANYLGWRKSKHAGDGVRLFTRKGTLAPRLVLAPKVKLQSAEIVQSPLGRLRGYATLHLGLAGGKLSLQGLPLEEACELRRDIVETIAAVDYSALGR